jgi:hypothetical protein
MVPKIFEIFAKKFAGPGNPLENKGKPLQKISQKRNGAETLPRHLRRKIFLAG